MSAHSGGTEERLQNLGFSMLSSIHWIYVVLILVLFAGIVVYSNEKKKKQSAEAQRRDDDILRRSDQSLNKYLNPDGSINLEEFQVASKTPSAVDGNEADAPPRYADDAINREIKRKYSGKALSQLQGLMRSGQLFSFTNSLLSTPQKIGEKLQARFKESAEQNLASRLRDQYGRNNPLIEMQIREELNKQKATDGDPLTFQLCNNKELSFADIEKLDKLF